MQITAKDIQQFRERAKTELQSNGAVGRLAWDAVVNALCNEVEELRKNAAPGNASAMREALESAHRTLKLVCEHAGEFVQPRLAEEIIHSGAAVERALAAPPTPPSDAAKMREAILAIKELNDRRPHDAAGYEINDIIEEALAAPARNCDRFATEDEAREAYWAYREPLEFNNKPFVAITEWLFDKAEGDKE